jgi:hypothetical protein
MSQGEGSEAGWARYYAERDAATRIRAIRHEIADRDAKIRFLLEHYNLWSEDGVFCFPDGEIWRRHD